MTRLSFTLATLAAVALPLSAEDGPLALKDALTQGKPSVFLRARSEMVDQDGRPEDAVANTLRIAIGYTTKAWYGLSASAQFEGVYDLGGSDYSHPLDPDANRPTILDIGTTNELQQAWLGYAPAQVPGASAKVGRQEVAFDNQRWIGPVAWRQDWQSFDAASAVYAPKEGALKTVTLNYVYLSRVNRIFPETAASGAQDIEGSAVNVAWKSCPYLDLIGYAYLFDFQPGGPVSTNLSTTTLGLRGTGGYPLNETIALKYTAEFAQQSDSGENTITVDQNYLFAEIGVGWKSLNVFVGYEVLGGDSTQAGNVLNTPLATVHAFNGWADVFATTPAGGLVDLYIKIGGAVPDVKGLSFWAFWHDFSADDSAVAEGDYGTEIDLVAEYSMHQWDPNLLLGLKYAAFSADSTAFVDITKFWVYTQYKF